MLKTGDFNITIPRQLDLLNRRRMDPLEYKGRNHSDCMYHTQQSFKGYYKTNVANTPVTHSPLAASIGDGLKFTIS